MLKIEIGGWVLILKMLTDAYVRMGGWVTNFRFAYGCLRGGGWVVLVQSLAYVICVRSLT